MNIFTMAMGLIVACTVVCFGQGASERLKVVEIIGFEGEKEYRAISDADLKQLKDDIKFEAKFIDKAHSNARDEWKARKQPGGFAFSKPQPRKIIEKNSLGAEAANKMVDTLTENESKAQDRKAEKESEKLKKMGKDTKKADSYANKKASMAAGREIFVAKLEELVNAAKAGTPPPGEAAKPDAGAKAAAGAKAE